MQKVIIKKINGVTLSVELHIEVSDGTTTTKKNLTSFGGVSWFGFVLGFFPLFACKRLEVTTY